MTFLFVKLDLARRGMISSESQRGVTDPEVSVVDLLYVQLFFFHFLLLRSGSLMHKTKEVL